MPAYLSAADAPVARGTVSYLRTGVALADLVLAVHADRAPSFGEGDVVDVTLTDTDGQAFHFVMACRRLGIEAGHWRAYLRGGRGRLGREIPARFYRDADGTRILADALAACGEVIAEGASLPERLPAYVRRRGPAFADVRSLLSQFPEATWRVVPDGSIFAGRETWPEAPEPVRVVQQSPQFDRVLCEPAPEVLPGMRVGDDNGTLLGGVERVVHQVTDRLRTELWLGEGGEMRGTERLRADFRATVHDAVPELPYLTLVAAKVLQDHGNHTIDVEPLDGFLPMMTDVRYEVPFSGARCRVRAGAIVLVGFEGAVISRPHALAFRAGDLEFLRVECGACVLELDADAGRILIAAPIIEVTPTTRMQAGGGFGLGVDAASGAVTLRGATVDINP